MSLSSEIHNLELTLEFSNGFRLCPCQVSMYEAFMQRVAQLERRMGELMTRGMDEKIRLQGRVMFNDLVDLSLFLYESHK